MKEFKNKLTGDIIDFYQFVMMTFDKAEELCKENDELPWCNLTKEEQISLFCKSYEDLEKFWRETNS